MPLLKKFEKMLNGPENGGNRTNIIETIKKKADKVVQGGEKVLAGVMKAGVAVKELGLNITKGKPVDEVITDFAETVSSKDAEQLTKVIVKHHFPQSNELGSKTTKVIKPPTVAPPRQQSLEIARPLEYPLVLLKEVLHVYDGRRDDFPEIDRARRYCRFAAHSYGDLEDFVLPVGCKQIDCLMTTEGLRAVVYSDHNDIVCAFAGSQNIKDWENNFTQLFGESKQYEEALDYAKELQTRYRGQNIIFVGHSQGGGEAAYCAYNLGTRAETYNPAGLSIFTKYKGGYKKGAHIDAYVFSTDILNTLQSAVGIETDGNVHHVEANIFQHGAHGIKGILRYYKIRYQKRKKK